MDVCPKCAYRRQNGDAEPDLECPRCGIVFAKYAKYHAPAVETPVNSTTGPGETGADTEAGGSLRLRERLLELPERTDILTLGVQAGVLGVLIVWGVRLIACRWLTAEIMSSFLHNVDLPIHEFGHVMFRPFGQWMTYLGGSLFQCLLPALIGAAFLWKMHNPFGAAFCLWWTGENLLDVAPYIGDAKLMALPLVGEWDDAVAEMHILRHDWHNILAPLGLLNAAPALAAWTHFLGAGLMVLSWLWAGTWLWTAWRELRLQDTGDVLS